MRRARSIVRVAPERIVPENRRPADVTRTGAYRLADGEDGEMDPTKRLLFWLKVPYAADVALVLIGIALIAAGRSVGWWVVVFAVVRAVVGTIALFWVAPRMLARRSANPPR